jgi:probable HAF family extracellular repeat protein
MSMSRTNKSIRTLTLLCWLAMAGVAMGQGTIVPVPHLGGGHGSVRALNNAGAVTGSSFTPSNEQHAFLFSGGVLQDLGTLGGRFSEGIVLNDFGVVAGEAKQPDDGDPQHAFVFRNGTMTDLSGLAVDQFSSAALINNAGDIAGVASWSDPLPRAFISRNGQMIDIGSLGGGLSTILDLNESGHAVGHSADDSFNTVAFLYDGMTMHSLGMMGGMGSFATAINDSGVIVGEIAFDQNVTRAFVYRDGVMTDLGTLGGESSWARGINNAGQIFGYSEYRTNDLARHAFIIDNGVMIDLGTLGGTVSHPLAMNNQGHVIGDSEDDLGFPVPFLYRNGQMVNVNSLLPPDSGWEIDAALYINDAGQIAGFGSHNGEFAWYILTPGNDNTNRAPEANAGDDQTAECGSSVQLDGSGSRDADFDVLTYQWRNGETVLGTSAILNVTLPRGTHTLTLAVTDSSGASDDDTVRITVNDTTPPSVACPVNQTVPVGADCQALVPDFATVAVAIDSCSAVLTRSQTPAAGTSVGLGSHTVTVSVSDEAGNVGTCAVTLTVIDGIAPVGDCPPARSVSGCTALVPDFTANLPATDNCTPAGALVKTQSPAAGTRVNSGIHVINLTVTDAVGNSSACSTTFTVTGGGSDGPSVTGPDSITIDAEPDGRGVVPDFTSVVTVVEGCNGPVTVRQIPRAGRPLKPGEHTVTVRVKDAVGNTAIHTILLNVVDRTAPAIKSIRVDPGLIKDDDGDMVRFKVRVRANDNCDDAPKSRIVSITSSEPITGDGDNTSPDCLITDDLRGRVRAERGAATTRLYTITVLCTDRSGNVAQGTTTITVVNKPKKKQN